MDWTELLDQWEQGQAGGRLGRRGTADGLGQAFFLRLMESYSRDPAGVLRLGRHWKRVAHAASDAAWAYRAAGVYERTRGRFRASANAFLQAGRLADDPVNREAFAIGAIDSLAKCRAVEEAEELAKRIARRLRRLDQPALAARAELNLGNVLLYQDRMDDARKVLARAIPALIEGGFALEAASAKLGLSSTHLFGGSPREALALATNLVEEAAENDWEYLGQLAELNLALAHIITNRAELAHRDLESLAPKMEGSHVDLDRIREYQADALLQLNMWSEAEELYADLSLSNRGRPALAQANILLGWAQALAVQNRPACRAVFNQARRQYARIGNKPWQAACLLGMAEGLRGRRRMALLQEAERLAEGSPAHLVRVLLAQCAAGVDRLAEATKLVHRYGYLGLEWQTHWLAAQSARNPGPHFRRMFAALRNGRLAQRSAAARLAFTKDKGAALQAYLGWLLSDPNPKRVREAADAVMQMRSVTLIDEIMNSSVLPASVVASLNAARQEIESTVEVETPGASRSTLAPTTTLSRAHSVATRALLSLDLAIADHQGQADSGWIIAETDRGVFAMKGNECHLLTRQPDEFARLVRFLNFEVTSPLTSASSVADPTMRVAREVAKVLSPVWDSDAEWVCPDGLGWRIPWSLCSWAAGHKREWGVALHPRMTETDCAPIDAESRVLVWMGHVTDLAWARKEVDAVAARFQHVTVAKTADEARASMDNEYDVVHVVSHAVHRAQNPMMSAVIFPDGQVPAFEISQSRLRTRLATLSACDTGALSLVNRQEPDGLVRAFVGRGARTVVASQWPLDDEAAYRQFNAFFEAVVDKNDVKSSLLRARCICRDWNEHPYYWAGLALYTGNKQ